jgi:hypothetical protein
LVIPTRPESGEIRNDAEVIGLVQARQQLFVATHDHAGRGVELIGNGSRRERSAVRETG